MPINNSKLTSKGDLFIIPNVMSAMKKENLVPEKPLLSPLWFLKEKINISSARGILK